MVKVYVDPAGTLVEEYEQGHCVILDDGHLKVLAGKRGNGDVIAIFHPGGWHHADVDPPNVDAR
jgi:hypothetical protein